MHPNAELIHRFYTCFQGRDAGGMGECYAPDAQFSDPIFRDLKGDQVRAMWKMLCERGKDLEIEFRDAEANDRRGRVHWDAWYTFSGTGRQVHNSIEARFEMADGRIVRHEDSFDLWKWASQALGWKGKLLGWAPPLQNVVRRQAKHGLEEYIRKRGLV